MADVFTKAKRSEVMSRIRSRGNKDTELALARLLRANRISGWRRQKTLIIRSSQRQLAHCSSGGSKSGAGSSVRADSRRRLRVRVDFVFRKARTVIFVDGCFWHGCPKHATTPKNNRAFWHRKLAGNQARDALVNRTLRRTGWRVVRIWECSLAKQPGQCVSRVQRAIARA
ncbi:MAG: very short patch repair endonuclease [Verrucomicrobia bacterium]|nr:very short patch repair endonuclease [Verrucomicrobiota bacterium]